jgi:hypothetical protein
MLLAKTNFVQKPQANCLQHQVTKSSKWKIIMQTYSTSHFQVQSEIHTKKNFHFRDF